MVLRRVFWPMLQVPSSEMLLAPSGSPPTIWQFGDELAAKIERDTPQLVGQAWLSGLNLTAPLPEAVVVVDDASRAPARGSRPVRMLVDGRRCAREVPAEGGLVKVRLVGAKCDAEPAAGPVGDGVGRERRAPNLRLHGGPDPAAAGRAVLSRISVLSTLRPRLRTRRRCCGPRCRRRWWRRGSAARPRARGSGWHPGEDRAALAGRAGPLGLPELKCRVAQDQLAAGRRTWKIRSMPSITLSCRPG